VDDDPHPRLALQAGAQVARKAVNQRARLNPNHCHVVWASDGVTNISEARRNMPDLMILYLRLPAGDGFSVLERMKANEDLASIPVIVLSGQDRVDNRDRAIRAGAKTFLQKPIEHGKLLAVIRLILGAKDHPPALVYDLCDAGSKN
jgi:DNA-binding response OmpR family regulator